MSFSHKLPPDIEEKIAAAAAARVQRKSAGGRQGRRKEDLDILQREIDQHNASSHNAKAPTPDDWWRAEIIDVQELCDRRFPELKYVVPTLIPEGITLLASRPKLGKSWLILQITTAVANGTVTLTAGNGSPPVGDVLYLALEDNPRRLQRRLTKYFGARKETWPARLKVVTKWRRLDKGGLDGIRAWCKSAPNPILIAIDTLKKVRAPKRAGQSDYDADYEACEGLQQLAGELGLSIIVAHHDRKMGADDVFDTVSGTLGLTGGVDAIALLKRNANGVTLHIQGRDMEEEVEKAVMFDRETCRWAILGEASELQQKSEKDRVLKALGDSDAAEGMTPSEIWTAAGFTTLNATNVALSRMAADGLVERVKRGVYGLPGTRTKLASKKDCKFVSSDQKDTGGQ